jgi:hypothetical protein
MRIHCRVVLVMAFSGILLCGKAQSRVQAESGLLDARHWNFSEHSLGLSGYWKFYDGKLLVEEDRNAGTFGAYHFFPGLWNEKRSDKSGIGYGTYSLKILIPPGIESLALEIPQLYNCYTLYINGKVVASAGKPGTTKEENTPRWIHQTAVFPVQGKDTLNVVLQIANFHHYKGGVRDLLYLGTPEKIGSHFGWEKITNIVEAVSVLLIGIIFLVLYGRTKKQVVLFFALLSLTWLLRSLFSKLYLIVGFIPGIGWNTVVRVEYMTLYFGGIWALLFLYFLFKGIGSSQLLITVLIVLNMIFVVFTLFTPPVIFTKWITLYLAVCAIIVLYGAIMVVRALFFEHAGAWFLMASILTGVIMFGYDIVAYQATLSYNFIFLNIGYVVMFILTSIALLFHLDILKSKYDNDVLKYDDMFRKE